MRCVIPCVGFESRSRLLFTYLKTHVSPPTSRQSAITFRFRFLTCLFLVVDTAISPKTSYLAGGVAYNMKVKHLEKFDAIPNKEFWTSLPGLVAAGFDFTKQKIQEQIDKHRGGGSSYSGLP